MDRYRLTERTQSAEISIEGGPEPFDCKNLSVADSASETLEAAPGSELESDSTIQGIEPGMGSLDDGGQPDGGSGSEISCDVPEDGVVFEGLSMCMDIAAGSAENVLTVPATAVAGRLGVLISMAIVSNPRLINSVLATGLDEMPGFLVNAPCWAWGFPLR